MLYVILGFIIPLFISLFYWREKIMVALGTGFVGIVFGFLFWMLVGGFIGAFLPVEAQVTEQKLYALNDGSNVEGHYFLMSGHIDEEPVYKYIVETEKGFHMETINIEKGYIKETDGQPIMKTYRQKFKDGTYWLIASSLFLDVFDYVEFYIPKGSVINEYSIDLQ